MSNLKKRVSELIALAEEAVKTATKVCAYKEECSVLRSKTEGLASLLRFVAKLIPSGDFYDRPALRILDKSQQVLEKVRELLLKCVAQGYVSVTRFIVILPVSSFIETTRLLEDSIGDLLWLLRFWDPSDDEDSSLPPIAAMEPTLAFIWKQIAGMYKGSLDDPSDADFYLISLSTDYQRYVKLIIEEGGIEAAMRMFSFRFSTTEGQVYAARMIGYLGRHQESVERMINADVCPVFAKMLKQGPMKVQAAVAWAVSELAANYPKWQGLFAPYNIIRFLVSHLEFETIEEGHNTEVGAQRTTSMHAIVMMSNNSKAPDRSIISGFEEEDASLIKDSHSRRKSEDPDTKAEMKAMAAKALSRLAAGNVSICRSIAETRALLCFSILLDKGSEEIRYNCAMVLLGITAMAELDIDLKRAALKPSSLVYKALADQLQKIIENVDEPEDLIVLCIKVIGNLASTLRGTGIRMIPPLVRFLDHLDVDFCVEASIALSKFACTDNYLHLKHSSAIITAGGVNHLIHLVYFGETKVQIPAILLLCYICMDLPTSKEVIINEALTAVEWASKQRLLLCDEAVKTPVLEAIEKLQLCQRRHHFLSLLHVPDG